MAVIPRAPVTLLIAVKDCQKPVFRIVGCSVAIDCRDRPAAELIFTNFAAMQDHLGSNPISSTRSGGEATVHNSAWLGRGMS